MDYGGDEHGSATNVFLYLLMYNEHGNGSTIFTGIEHLLGFKQCPVKTFHLNLAKHLQIQRERERERERGERERERERN